MSNEKCSGFWGWAFQMIIVNFAFYIEQEYLFGGGKP
jgi:hypothetical protein